MCVVLSASAFGFVSPPRQRTLLWRFAADTAAYSLGAVKRWWPVAVIVVVLVLVGAGAALLVDWTWKRKLSPRGGRPFLTRVELPVPSFQQGDGKWRDDSLGGVPENGTLGGEGCAVAAAAMVFKFYGITSIRSS